MSLNHSVMHVTLFIIYAYNYKYIDLHRKIFDLFLCLIVYFSECLFFCGAILTLCFICFQLLGHFGQFILVCTKALIGQTYLYCVLYIYYSYGCLDIDIREIEREGERARDKERERKERERERERERKIFK